MTEPLARVLVLGGPSGAGKSRLAARLQRRHGWPVVRLDDFYKEIDDPSLPMTDMGIADWDDVGSYRLDAAIAALEELCTTGSVSAPEYAISTSRVVGTHTITLAGATTVVAEGIFAGDVIAPLQQRGLLREALCVRQNAWLTFARRLTRDLQERRKPPTVLLRRGLRLRAAESGIVAAYEELGARPIRPAQAERVLADG